MKNILTLFLLVVISSNLFSQGVGNAKTTQSLEFPTSINVTEGKARIYIMRTTGTLWN